MDCNDTTPRFCNFTKSPVEDSVFEVQKKKKGITSIYTNGVKQE